jgi:hypothetical protein
MTSAITAADTATTRPPRSPFTESMLPHRRNAAAADRARSAVLSVESPCCGKDQWRITGGTRASVSDCRHRVHGGGRHGGRGCPRPLAPWYANPTTVRHEECGSSVPGRRRSGVSAGGVRTAAAVCTHRRDDSWHRDQQSAHDVDRGPQRRLPRSGLHGGWSLKRWSRPRHFRWHQRKRGTRHDHVLVPLGA